MLGTHWEFDENKLKTLWEHNGNNINLATQSSPQKKKYILAFWAHGVMNFTLFFEWA